MMSPLSEKQRQKILHSSPKGTWALLFMVGVGMVIAWLFIYFGVFLPRGSVN